MRSARVAVLTTLAVAAACVFASTASAKVPPLRFDNPVAVAGETVGARAIPFVGQPQPRRFLIHVHDLAAMFPPGRPAMFGKRARRASHDERLHPIALDRRADEEREDGYVPVDVTIPGDIAAGRYTTVAFGCRGGCFLAPALTAAAIERIDRTPGLRSLLLRITVATA